MIFLSLLVLFISISAVSAEGNLTALETQIEKSTDSFEITQDYAYSPTVDANYTIGAFVNKTNFIINGNGHTIDGKNQSRLFRIANANVTINDLIIKNGFSSDFGGGIFSQCDGLILNNVTFINDNAKTRGGAVVSINNALVNNCKFIDNYAPEGAAIYNEETYLKVNGSYFESSNLFQKAMIYGSLSAMDIYNCIFTNTTAKYAPAIYNDRKTYIYNSQFTNLKASLSAGAIHIKELDELLIESCNFINVTSTKNGGAAFIDTQGFLYNNTGITIINNTMFANCSSEFGGALVLLGGKNIIIQSTFENNSAKYDGGAIYLSFGENRLINTLIKNNKLTFADKNLTHGGGIYADYGILSGENNQFTNNTKHGLYSYETDLNITGSLFENNGEAIHGVFVDNYFLNNTYVNNENCLNDTNYETIVSEKVDKLELLNNTIIFSKLPKAFDLRDWEWVSSVKNQGTMNSCWAFGATGAMESALMKYVGVEYDFSENNVQNSLLKYSKFGNKGMSEGSDGVSHVIYAVNWLGMLNSFDDEYDNVGKISQFVSSSKNVHIQDAVIIDARKNSTDNKAIKEAILKYCGLTATLHSTTEAQYYNKNTSALYYNGIGNANHIVLIVGWDDTYSAKNFATAPPGDGAWIIKNSYGTEFGEEGYNYVSYYDTKIGMESDMVGYIFENDVQYTKNYQTDLGGKITHYEAISGGNSSYKNVYEAISDDLIAGVGTYFNEEGEAYTLEIFVNNQTKLTQSGIAPYKGYHTIKLNKTIAIREGDEFGVEMTKKYIPVLEYSRQHFENNTSFFKVGNEYTDLALQNKTASLKVYTIEAEIFTEDLVKIYKNASQFEAKIGAPNQVVSFEINGGVYNRTSNKEGIATMNINLNPGNYTIKTTFNGTTVENTITVLPTLIADDLVKYYRNGSQFYIMLIDGQGNPVAGKNITMNINGVFYYRVTNANGIAKLNINLEPNTYVLTAIDPLTGLQMSYTITVLPTLTAKDLDMKYLDGSKFEAKLVDGTGKALANKQITFNINGVFYQRTTDANGIAKLNIRLMAGEYIITSQYETATISNKITIRA